MFILSEGNLCFISMSSILNKISEYKCFYLSKDIPSQTFCCLLLKSSKGFSVGLLRLVGGFFMFMFSVSKGYLQESKNWVNLRVFSRNDYLRITLVIFVKGIAMLYYMVICTVTISLVKIITEEGMLVNEYW